MNIEQYPLLQYIIKKKDTYIYNSEGLNFWLYWLLFLIGLSHNVCTQRRVCAGTDEDTIFIRKVWDCPHMVICVLVDVGTYDFWTYDGIWISDINRDRIPELCGRYWDSFLSHCCSSIIYMHIRTVSSTVIL